jgi:rfaE bifunctional protein nucleotidyltransferase chain/domain
MGRFFLYDEATAWCAELRAQRAAMRLVLTNGHFDLLHVGHLDYLERARALGDGLFVAVNSDASTRRLKGPGRPLVPAEERARLLAALAPVDAAFVFDPPAAGPEADTACAVVRAFTPDVYAKGGDYAVAEADLLRDAATTAGPRRMLPERDTVTAYGGRVALIPYLPGRSTSALIARVRALPTAGA